MECSYVVLAQCIKIVLLNVKVIIPWKFITRFGVWGPFWIFMGDILRFYIFHNMGFILCLFFAFLGDFLQTFSLFPLLSFCPKFQLVANNVMWSTYWCTGFRWHVNISSTGTQRHKDTDTDTDTHKHTHWLTDRHTHRHTLNKKTHTHTNTDRDSHSHIYFNGFVILKLPLSTNYKSLLSLSEHH